MRKSFFFWAVVIFLGVFNTACSGPDYSSKEMKDEITRRYMDVCIDNIAEIKQNLSLFKNLDIEIAGKGRGEYEWKYGEEFVNSEGRKIMPAKLKLPLGVRSKRGESYTEVVEIGVHIYKDEFDKVHFKTIYPEYLLKYKP